MSCFHPVEAWQHVDGGAIRFSEFRGARPLKVPCGGCIGCRLARVRGWALRCLHEAQMHPQPSAFVTLTYDDDHLKSPSLNYSDFQRFMRRMRRYYGSPTRFFMAGEYGAQTHRPHFHALLFGRPFAGGSPAGKNIRINSDLNRLWTLGFSSVGAVTFQSAAYVASYTLKNSRLGNGSSDRYVDGSTGEVLARPFVQMSRNPGIGYTWFHKYWREVYAARDGVVLPGGHMYRAPRYYDKLLALSCPDLKEFKDFERYVNSARFVEDTTPQRLLSRELCALAAQKMKGTQL